MNKEIKILIDMCINDKESYTADELASFLNLKYTEGVYPYLTKLQKRDLVIKLSKGEYALKEENKKIEDIKFIIKIFGKNAEILFTNHAKRVLQRFSTEPIVTKSKLPSNNLRIIKNIASKTHIIYSIKEKKRESFFIACWEEPTKRLLDFFDIKPKFDIEEFKQKVVKYYSAIPNTQTPLDDAVSKELRRLNVEAYIGDKDNLLDKLKEINFPFLIVVDELTRNKEKSFVGNIFKLTSYINEWKMNYIYNTDKIEGNPLTLQQVKTILTVGALAPERDKKEVLETVNSRTALDNLFDPTNEISIDFIKKLHLATQQGIDTDAGQYKKKENCITDNSGILIDTTTPVEFVEKRMNDLMTWYNKNKEILHPFVLATIFHNQFVYIHPFNDGNGRVSRLIFNFILIKHGFFPIIFFNDEKQKYYGYLRHAKIGDIKPFLSFAMNLYRNQLDEIN
ncbi:MAG: Fic family protein [Nanoarchaeota archaeon]